MSLKMSKRDMGQTMVEVLTAASTSSAQVVMNGLFCNLGERVYETKFNDTA